MDLEKSRTMSSLSSNHSSDISYRLDNYGIGYGTFKQSFEMLITMSCSEMDFSNSMSIRVTFNVKNIGISALNKIFSHSLRVCPEAPFP